MNLGNKARVWLASEVAKATLQHNSMGATKSWKCEINTKILNDYKILLNYVIYTSIVKLILLQNSSEIYYCHLLLYNDKSYGFRN